MNPVVGVPPNVSVVGVPPLNLNNVASDNTNRGGKEIQGMPGTAASFALRLSQLGFALIALAIMSSVKDFDSVTAFCYLVAATAFQSLWSLFMAALDAYALLFKRAIRKSPATSLFAFGDWLTATLTLAAACSSAGITVLLGKDLDQCGPNDCGKFDAAVAMTFISWFSTSLSFFFTFWLLASR